MSDLFCLDLVVLSMSANLKRFAALQTFNSSKSRSHRPAINPVGSVIADSMQLIAGFRKPAPIGEQLTMSPSVSKPFKIN